MSFTTSAQVRRHIVDALRADLVGPFSPDRNAEEVWDLAPSKRYLCGFLVPREQAQLAEDDDDDPNETEMLEAGDDPNDESQNDPQAKRRPLLPSSIGLSVLLPAGPPDTVSVHLEYADYVAETAEASTGKNGKPRRGRPPLHWRRVARGPVAYEVPLDRDHLARGIDVGGGLRLFGQLDATEGVQGLARGTRALSLFVVNDRAPVADKGKRDEGYAFQVVLALRYPRGLIARPDLAGRAARAWDDLVMDLQFRDRQSYASGHGVAVRPIVEDGRVVGARTEWVPEATVKRVDTRSIEGVEVEMEQLARLDDAAAVRRALRGIPEKYAAWLNAQRATKCSALDDKRRKVAHTVLSKAGVAKDRISKGIEVLAGHAEARRAFCIANRAMALAARQRSPERYEADVPKWRLFQLAFVLLNLPSIIDPKHPNRETVELIFFPTGGGKTEAYLGVVAFTLIWRRLTGTDRPDRGLGVAVILRYTLRLLTLDQLGRAATLICALEILRKAHPDLGAVRFSLGLWVGRSATANRLTDVARKITDYRNASSALSPFPLATCPWCQRAIEASCMKVLPNQKNPVEVEVGCRDFSCAFSPRNGGLPVLFVDEQIYRELPSFIVATVDKFAMLPWRGESGALFGQVRERRGRVFVGPCTPPPAFIKDPREKLPEGLRPPELIVQDELHLISGPLGTMVGLYETAIERLATHHRDGHAIKPKIIASTATVKRAHHQIQALYGREDTAMFPPLGIDDSESFFARVDTQANERMYVGVAAAGRSAKAVLVTVYAALLAAAEKCVDPDGPADQPVDPYMTLVGYFNNLRELGGMRRLVEDLVPARAANRGTLKPLGVENVGGNRWMANRELKRPPIELTSRESTSAISRSKELLGRHFLEDGFIPTVLASSMISVGVDIERLGLMVVAGQPKSTSEYIQASSRVGRDDRRPGLVVTCYNLNKPRDRSYYEHFGDYHACFYRHVESTSVTPFSGPALERGLAGCLIGMVRHGAVEMAQPEDVMDVEAHRDVVAAAIDALAGRAKSQPGTDGASAQVEEALRIRAEQVIDRWTTFIAHAKAGGARRCYSPYDPGRRGVPLLHTALDEKRAQAKGMDDAERFVAPTSMRDVEPTVHLWLRPAGWSLGGGRS